MFRLVIVFACRLTNMTAEDVQHFLTPISRIFRQVEELVSAAYAYGVTTML